MKRMDTPPNVCEYAHVHSTFKKTYSNVVHAVFHPAPQYSGYETHAYACINGGTNIYKCVQMAL